jgi:hypothetical protein
MEALEKRQQIPRYLVDEPGRHDAVEGVIRKWRRQRIGQEEMEFAVAERSSGRAQQPRVGDLCQLLHVRRRFGELHGVAAHHGFRDHEQERIDIDDRGFAGVEAAM